MRTAQIAILCVLALAVWGCKPSAPLKATPVEMANPAAVNCLNLGGQLQTKQTKLGEFGMCQLPSGKLCEEWALFRGECS